MSEDCRNPLCRVKLEGNRSRGTQRQFCDDRCRLIHWILKKAAKLLAPFGWEILLNSAEKDRYEKTTDAEVKRELDRLKTELEQLPERWEFRPR